MENTEKVVVSREMEEAVMNAMYDFVLNTTLNHSYAKPEELAILPSTTQLLFDYWSIPS